MAAEREYAGYAGSPGIFDWGAAVQGITDSIHEVEDARAARRAENERLFQEANKMLSETEQSKSKTLNEFILQGVDQGRTKLYDWYNQLQRGELKAVDYKRRKQNLEDYWNSLSTVTKSIDQRLAQALERQQPGAEGELPPASRLEADMQMRFGELANLQNKNIVIGDDGRVMVGRYDESGNLLSTEDVKYINNPANVAFNRVDLSGMVAADVKNWGDWSIGRVSDMRNNPQFKMAENRLIDAVTSSPRSAASILFDNTNQDYQVYFDEQDKQSKLSQLKSMYAESGQPLSDADAEKMMVLMKQDANGDYQPVLTEDQLKAAKDVVKSEIELQVGRKVEPAPYYGGGRDNGPDWEDLRDMDRETEDNIAGYVAVFNGWTKGDFSRLAAGYRYEKSGSGDNYTIKVYKPNSRGRGETLYKTVTDPKGLAEFAFSGDPNTNITRFNYGKKAYYERGMNRNQTEKKQEKKPESKTVRVRLANGREGEIPASSLNQFLKENKGAKKIK